MAVEATRKGRRIVSRQPVSLLITDWTASANPVTLASGQTVTANAGTGTFNADLVKPASRTPLFASVAVSASGANSIVAADASNKIKVMGGLLVSNGTVNAKWQSATTDLTGLAYLVVNTGYVLPMAGQFHYFETAVNAALNLNLSAAIAVGGFIVYIKEAS